MKLAFPPGHFYSPVVAPDELLPRRDALWKKNDELLGVDVSGATHRHVLQTVFPKFVRDFDYPTNLPETDGLRTFFVNNSQFSWLDARLLFVLLREWRPARIIEVGAGFSSLLMADVNRRFLNEECELTCIEPYPRPFLKKRIRGLSKLVEVGVQQVPVEEFLRLRAGDVLFIDSSHVVKTGSDVNYLIFEVLPRLAKGVYVHFHDIFFPQEYPEEWVLQENRSWNEQYIVRALLMYSSAFKIYFGSSLAFAYHHDLLKEALAQPDGAVWAGSSLWLQTI